MHRKLVNRKEVELNCIPTGMAHFGRQLTSRRVDPELFQDGVDLVWGVRGRPGGSVGGCGRGRPR